MIISNNIYRNIHSTFYNIAKDYIFFVRNDLDPGTYRWTEKKNDVILCTPIHTFRPNRNHLFGEVIYFNDEIRKIHKDFIDYNHMTYDLNLEYFDQIEVKDLVVDNILNFNKNRRLNKPNFDSFCTKIKFLENPTRTLKEGYTIED